MKSLIMICIAVLTFNIFGNSWCEENKQEFKKIIQKSIDIKKQWLEELKKEKDEIDKYEKLIISDGKNAKFYLVMIELRQKIILFIKAEIRRIQEIIDFFEDKLKCD